MHYILNLIGIYLTIIGTWRLANATKGAPVGQFIQQAEEDNSYNPLKDLVTPHKVIVWAYQTIRSFGNKGKMTDSVILHKQFNWGLLWLLFGMVIQYVAGFL